MLSGPTPESPADIFPIQELPVPLLKDAFRSQSMFDPHPVQAGSSARLTSIKEA